LDKNLTNIPITQTSCLSHFSTMSIWFKFGSDRIVCFTIRQQNNKFF